MRKPPTCVDSMQPVVTSPLQASANLHRLAHGTSMLCKTATMTRLDIGCIVERINHYLYLHAIMLH